MYDRYTDREQAARATTDIIADAIERRTDAGEQASLVVSGGSSPGRVFELLAERDLPWSNVHVTLSDERWVAADHGDSNEAMVRSQLLAGAAANAEFHPLYAEGVSIDERAEVLGDELRLMPFPFACSLLGMGEDGHFASLFPDADNLTEGLDADGSNIAIPVATAASPHPRISLTLAALSRSDVIVLLIFGERKLEVLKEALADADAYPVGELLLQKRAPVKVLWAP